MLSSVLKHVVHSDGVLIQRIKAYCILDDYHAFQSPIRECNLHIMYTRSHSIGIRDLNFRAGTIKGHSCTLDPESSIHLKSVNHNNNHKFQFLSHCMLRDRDQLMSTCVLRKLEEVMLPWATTASPSSFSKCSGIRPQPPKKKGCAQLPKFKP
jgi:hypothetical protein